MNGREQSDRKDELYIKNVLLPQMPGYVATYCAYITPMTTPITRKNYLKVIRRYLKWISDDVEAIDISKTMPNAIDYLAHVSSRENSFSVATKKAAYFALNSFYNFLTDTNVVETNLLTKQKIRGKDHVMHIDISDKQLVEILAKVDVDTLEGRKRTIGTEWKKRDRLILLILMHTGIRESGLCSLDISNIDFKNGTMWAIDKGEKRHEYDISNIMTDVLDWLIARDSILRKAPMVNKDEEDALFISQKRMRLTPHAVALITKKYSKNVTENGISPHKFRSAYIKMLYDETHDLEFVRSAVGHANVTTTQRYLPESKTAKHAAESIVSRRLRTV